MRGKARSTLTRGSTSVLSPAQARLTTRGTAIIARHRPGAHRPGVTDLYEWTAISGCPGLHPRYKS